MLPAFKIIEQLDQKTASIHDLDIREKIRSLSDYLKQNNSVKKRNMLSLIMYDIENNKIRTHIAKYLIRRGCMRIQKSVYLYKGNKSEISTIKSTLQEVNEAYDNQDSIFVIPVPQEKFKNIKVIGKSITFDLILSPKNVLVF